MNTNGITEGKAPDSKTILICCSSLKNAYTRVRFVLLVGISCHGREERTEGEGGGEVKGGNEDEAECQVLLAGPFF